MTIYVDLLFFDNFIMNFIILWIVDRLSSCNANPWRLAVAAGIGALYVIGSFWPTLYFLNNISFKVVLSAMMILLGFHIERWRDFLRLSAVFYMLTFLFGGVAFGILYFTNQNFMLANGGFYIHGYPVVTMIIAAVFAYIITGYCWRYMRARLDRKRLMMSAEVALDGKVVKANAMLDTGNVLHDPISNYPVVIAEISCIKELLPDALASIIQAGNEADIGAIMEALNESPCMLRFRLIPFNSIGQSNGMMVGFRPDYIKVFTPEQTIESKEIIIGICNSRLSQDDAYTMLLNPGLIM